MAKDPAFLFYSSDFLSGTLLMSNEELGIYIKLLCLQHQKGHLTKKDMLNICGSYNEDIFCKFLIDEEGKYFNERLDIEINKRKAYSESRRRNRQKKEDETSTKEEDMNNICKTYEKDMNNISNSYEKHMENENEDININKNIYINIYEYIEKEFGRTLTPSEYEVISDWEDTELTRYAIKQAILNGAPRIKYIQAILDSYKSKNIKSVQEAQKDEKNFKKKKEGNLPEWFGKEIKVEEDKDAKEFAERVRKYHQQHKKS